jgi:hypothetical protein
MFFPLFFEALQQASQSECLFLSLFGAPAPLGINIFFNLLAGNLISSEIEQKLHCRHLNQIFLASSFSIAA